jgi:hypothetical protein
MEPPDDLDVAYGEEPPFPPLVTAAGWIWIAFGVMFLLSLMVSLAMTFALGMRANSEETGAHFAGGICGLGCVGLFGAAFLFVGVQSIRGTARDTLGNGVGSIVFGGLYFGFAAVMTVGGQIIPAGIVGVGFIMLLLAGIFALMGRGQYKLWRKAQKDEVEREAASRRARRRSRE